MGTMKTMARADPEQFKKAYEQGYRTFYNIRNQAASNPGLLHDCLRTFPDVMKNYPAFPPSQFETLDRTTGEGVFSGSSFWSDASQQGMHVEEANFTVMIPRPVDVVIEDTQENRAESVQVSWFGETDHHTLVLFFAWKAVLSAGWVDMFCDNKRSATMRKTQTGAEDEHRPRKRINVELLDVSEKAYHWWCDVLSLGSGCAPQLEIDGVVGCSPWSTCLKGQYAFSVHRARTCDGHGAHSGGYHETTFSQSVDNILAYCKHHDASGQGLAGLYAALLIPMASHYGHSITLSAPSCASRVPTSANDHLHTPRLNHVVSQLNELATLSCNVRGVKSLLHSVFFSIDVTCDVAGAWLQGALQIVHGIESEAHAAATLMLRDPAIGALWAGAYVLGIQDQVFEELTKGVWEVDLVTAAVTGTMESFFQAPSDPLEPEATDISLADKCRIAAQIYGIEALAFPPPGRLALDVVEDDVLDLARQGRSHLAFLRAFAWRDKDGRSQQVEPLIMPGLRMKKTGDEVWYEADPKGVRDMMLVPFAWAGEVDYEGMNMAGDDVSRNTMESSKMGINVWIVSKEGADEM